MDLRSVFENELREIGFVLFGTGESSGPQISMHHPKNALQSCPNVLSTKN